MTKDPEYLTQAETAERLGISVRQLQNLRNAGAITPEVNPHTRRLRFKTTDVNQLVEDRRRYQQAKA